MERTKRSLPSQSGSAGNGSCYSCYTALTAETASITPVMRHQLLIQAIGEENLFREILSRHPALLTAAKSPAEELLAGLKDPKQVLRYNNNTIAEKLSLSRTTLWRLTSGREE